MAAPLYTTSSGLLWHAGKILIVVAGLPARGKTHISRSLERYLRWNGVTTEVYSLGDYRRKTLGHAKDLPSDYFSPGEKSGDTTSLRQSVRDRCERDILDFFEQAGQVAIYDANNGTRESRLTLYNKFHSLGYHVIFLESVCNNQEIVLANIRSVKISSPDYLHWDPDKAVEDYMRRIADHERHYEPVEETDIPWIRLVNVGERVEVNKVYGYLQSRIVFFLMNIHNRHRFIYFARSGQSLIEHSYRADSDLSPAGWDYARRLKNFMLERRYLNMEERKKTNGGTAEDRNLVIWTSSRRRSHHTAWPFIKEGAAATQASMSSTDPVATSTPSGNGKSPPIMKSPADFDEVIPLPHEEGITVPGPSSPGPPASTNLPPNQLAYPKIKVAEKSRLCEINPGVWDGLSPDDVQNRYPAEWEDFQNDPYGHRAPRAESYHDLCIRLEPILIELEDCKDDLLIISHASVIRCLLAYLVGLPAHEVPAVDIARGDLIEVQPSAYGVKTRMFHFWSGPGRKDAEGAATKGLDREMEEAEAKASEDAAVAAREEGVRKIYGPGIDTDVNSPPKSKLHLDRAYKSRNPSQADLSEMMGTMTPQEETTATGKRKAKHGEDGSGNGIWKVDDGVARRDSRILDEGMRQALSRAMTPSTSIFPDGEEDVKDSPADLRGPEPPAGDQAPKKTEEETPDIVPPTAPEVVKEKGEEEEEQTQASKVLPKVERSLGADEALRVAAEKEAADMRPTFYENVVEGAVKPKKLGASGTLVTSTPNLAPREIGSA